MELREAISPHALYHLKLETYFDPFLRSLVYKIKTEFLSEKLVDETIHAKFFFPKTWWQMFKQEHFPKWLLTRFPVKEDVFIKRYRFTKHAVYPELPHTFTKAKKYYLREFLNPLDSNRRLEV